MASTYFLRFAILILGVGVLALCIFALPSMWTGGPEEFPSASTSVYLIVIAIYLSTIPFYIALWQALNLLRYIDLNTAFSDLSINALYRIKLCAAFITVLYIVCVPLLIPIAHADDAPGIILFGAVIAGAPFTITIFVAILQRLLQSAIDMKLENDFTV